MKNEFLLADLLALLEILNEHMDRNYPGGDPPKVLKKLQMKLGHLAGMFERNSQESGTGARRKSNKAGGVQKRLRQSPAAT